MRKGGLTSEWTPLSRAYTLAPPEARGLRPSLGRDEWQHTNRQGRLAAGERERSAVSWRPRAVTDRFVARNAQGTEAIAFWWKNRGESCGRVTTWNARDS